MGVKMSIYLGSGEKGGERSRTTVCPCAKVEYVKDHEGKDRNGGKFGINKVTNILKLGKRGGDFGDIEQ